MIRVCIVLFIIYVQGAMRFFFFGTEEYYLFMYYVIAYKIHTKLSISYEINARAMLSLHVQTIYQKEKKKLRINLYRASNIRLGVSHDSSSITTSSKKCFVSNLFPECSIRSRHLPNCDRSHETLMVGSGEDLMKQMSKR